MAKPNFKDFLAVDNTGTDDPQLAKNAKKRKMTTTEAKDCDCNADCSCKGNCGDDCKCGPDCSSVDEALSMAQRRQKSRTMKKYKARLKVGRKKAQMKVANSKVLARRARKAARNAIAKKLTKGIAKADLTPARKAEIEKRLEKMTPRITRLAKKMTPKLRQAELGKRRG